MNLLITIKQLFSLSSYNVTGSLKNRNKKCLKNKKTRGLIVSIKNRNRLSIKLRKRSLDRN